MHPEHRVSQTDWAELNRDCASIPSTKNPVPQPIAKYRAVMEELRRWTPGPTSR